MRLRPPNSQTQVQLATADVLSLGRSSQFGLFPTRCRIAELSLEYKVIDHDLEAYVHIPSLPFLILSTAVFMLSKIPR